MNKILSIVVLSFILATRLRLPTQNKWSPSLENGKRFKKVEYLQTIASIVPRDMIIGPMTPTSQV